MIFDLLSDLKKHFFFFYGSELMCAMNRLLLVLWDSGWRCLELHLQLSVLMGLASAVALGHPTRFLFALQTFLDRLWTWTSMVLKWKGGLNQQEIFPGRASCFCTDFDVQAVTASEVEVLMSGRCFQLFDDRRHFHNPVFSTEVGDQHLFLETYFGSSLLFFYSWWTILIYTSWRSALSMHLVWTAVCFHNTHSLKHNMYLALYGSWANTGSGINYLLLNVFNNNCLLTVTEWKWRLYLSS